MTRAKELLGRGPFLAEHLPDGSPYELSAGHPILCAPSGRRHGGANLTGSLPLASDPGVTEAGIDVGYSLERGTLRAPDVAVGNVPDRPGWAEGAPPLAVEYADTGTDEADLQTKIGELLGAGSQLVWVVRLVGPRRVEVHRAGQPMQVVSTGQQLEAPGILENVVPVEAMFDRRAALEVTFRNLLQRKGYQSLDAVRSEGVAAGIETGLERGLEKGLEQGRLAEARSALRRVLARRNLPLSAEHEARIDATDELTQLERWHDQAVTAPSADEALST
jgi:Uma2 family endonuclease